jgi:hypothetical protein
MALTLSSAQTVYRAVRLCYYAAGIELCVARSTNEKPYTQGIFEGGFSHGGCARHFEQDADVGSGDSGSRESLGHIS